MSFANHSRARQPSLDAIDLTLSSPEPEETPSQRPQHQAGNTKSSLPHRTIAVKNEHSSRTATTANSLSYEQSKRIRPEDIAHIVNTTDSVHLRKVVIELCQMSPELSGAVARALAPRSRYAHALGMAHNPKPQTSLPRDQIRANQMKHPGDVRTPMRHNPPMVKSEYRPNTQNGAGLATPQSRGHSGITTPYTSSSSRPTAQSSLSRVKSESSSYSRSRDLYDDVLSRPGPPKPHTPHAQSPRAPFQVKPEPSSVTKSNSTFINKQAVVPQQSAQTGKGVKMCQQCHQKFTDIDDLCIWHPGSQVDEDDGKRWSCCGEVPSDLGCEFSSHVPEDGSSADG